VWPSSSDIICCLSFQTVGCRPIASLDHFLPEHLGSAGLVEEVPLGTSKVVKVRNSIVELVLQFKFHVSVLIYIHIIHVDHGYHSDIEDSVCGG
jgi:hypothetical protein